MMERFLTCKALKSAGLILQTMFMITQGHKIGYFDNSGYIYDEDGRRGGLVKGDGRVYDFENHYAGKIVGAHIQSGAAALLLLIR